MLKFHGMQGPGFNGFFFLLVPPGPGARTVPTSLEGVLHVCVNHPSFHWNKSHALSIKISARCFLKIRDDNII